MNSNFAPLVTAFESLADLINAATSENRSIAEIQPGYHSPAVDKVDLATMSTSLASLVKERAPDEFGKAEQSIISIYVPRIEMIKSQTVPYLFNGHGHLAVPALMATFQAMRSTFEVIWPAYEKVDAGTLPFKLARQARAAKARLEEAVFNVSDVEAQIATIASAHQAAEQLPADLEDLKAARTRLGAANEQAIADRRAISAALAEVQLFLGAARSSSEQADGYAKKSSEAYRFTTSHGLAAAFEERGRSLAQSMWVWVGGLLVALISVAIIGHNRVAALTSIVSAASPQWGAIALNLVLSVISVGAPLWFAWVATKQIGQRFRLSEDYGFKSSVAKAYEGYRREAISIDKEFEAELFSIALDRLREAPLRLVEEQSHGSPWHELLNSPAMLKAQATIPDLPTQVLAYVRKLQKSPVSSESDEAKS